ncbi:AraC family transcriptional regulator [Paenibacillus sp. IB182496]|uniref:AraC family transcriptional regulator n=1 Tax=Paenibacillus sabuli TaxID=2772509 RepID=A0A927BSW5_9BACL|nr:AraC family transcriptional regulator [Paenibacillus sabuli]
MAELAQRLERRTGRDGTHPTAIPQLELIRNTDVRATTFTLYQPAVCLVAQGAKQVTLGEEAYTYGPADYAVVSVELPVSSRLVEASTEAPYLAVKLKLEPRLLWEALREPDRTAGAARESTRGLYVDRASPELLDAALRLVRLLDQPEDIVYLAPLVVRELLYRVMYGPQGKRLRAMALSGTAAQRISAVMQEIRRRFTESLHVDQLAQLAHMGTSSLHRHFKALTAMSPLQYQKQLRLQEARRLLLTEPTDAAEAAFRVGYESPSQFSREYARLFGLPPIADTKRRIQSRADGETQE